MSWRILSSRSLTGSATKGDEANNEPAEDKKNNERYVIGGAAG